ncbi:MAG: phage tail assembly chaperone [Janthinobacterium lividum]
MKAKARGESTPLDNQPHLLPHLGFYLDAFQSLRYDRPIGMALGPIPWSSLDRYAQRYDVGDFDVFESHIRALENVLLQHEAKEAAK